jgi:triphosphoribosyl-dephospho-CoA synthase
MSTPWNSAPAIEAAYRAACWLDVAAFKPGNVSEASPGHGMTARDFCLSASVTAGILTEPGLSLGDAVFRAVAMTRRRVGCNTNLGILLLCAPIARAARACERPQELRQSLQRVIREANHADSARVFEAIRLASPGGLGSSPQYDVRQASPRAALRRVMAAAAEHDLIALQYATDYGDVFGTALPRLQSLWPRHRNEGCAVTELYLHLLARFPDSHVARKHGPDKAAEVTLRAGRARTVLASRPGPRARRYLEALDARLKAEDVNPGTTADLTVATLFLDRLIGRQEAGTAARKPARRAQPEQVAARETAFTTP